jgi:hypothetical protein
MLQTNDHAMTLEDVMDSLAITFDRWEVRELVKTYIESLTPEETKMALLKALIGFNALAGKELSTRSKLQCLEHAIRSGCEFIPGTAEIKLPEGLQARLRKPELTYY